MVLVQTKAQLPGEGFESIKKRTKLETKIAMQMAEYASKNFYKYISENNLKNSILETTSTPQNYGNLKSQMLIPVQSC